MMRACVAAMLAGLVSGCCPIPFPRTEVIQPAGEVKVVSGGEPVAGAVVWVAMEEAAPHPRPGAVERMEHVADAGGHVSLKQQTRRGWGYPLMMHGVTFYTWRVCAQAAGKAAKAAQWPGDEGRGELVLELEAGDGGCEALMPMAEHER